MSEAAVVHAIRALGGVELPATGVWRIDSSHTEVAFIGRHFMLTKIRGRFTGIEGSVTVAEDPNDTVVEVTIDTASVASGDTARDDHLRSADFFDVDSFPTAGFRGHVSSWSARAGKLVGELTIKGVSRPVTLEAEYIGFAQDPWGSERIVFSAAGTLNREDWGLSWNMVLDTGGILVSKDIRIEIELEAVYQR